MSSSVRPEPADDPGGLIAGYRARAAADDPGGLMASYHASAPPPAAPRDATQTLVAQPRARIRLPANTASIGPQDESPSTVTAKRLMTRTTEQAALGATPLGVAVNAARLASPVVGGIEAARGVIDDATSGHPLRAGAMTALAALPFIGPAAKAVGKAGLAAEDVARAAPAAEEGAADLSRMGAAVADSAVSKSLRLFPQARREAVGTAFRAPVDDGADPRLANIAKLGLSPDADLKVRTALAQLDPLKKRVTHAETKAVAAELGINPTRLLSRTDRMSGAELLAVRDVVSQNAERQVTLSKQAAALAPGTPERVQAEAELSHLASQNDELLVRYTKERSQTGRDLNALKIVARNSMDPTVWQVQAQRVKGLPLSTDEQARVATLTSSNDRDGLIRYVAGLHKSTPIDKGLTLWKAGLLTNPVTHLTNVASNVGMAALETAKEPLATGIDAVIAAVRGTDRTKALSLRGLTTEPVKAMVAARHQMLQTFLHGDAGEFAKWDFRKTNFGDGPTGRIAQAYTDAVFNSLSASDQAFKAAAVGRSLEEQARVAARKAADPAAELARLRAQPDPAMLTQAMEDAEYATFQNPNALAKAVTAAKGQFGPGGRAAAEISVPFVRTPTNVAGRLVDYSPLGFATTLARQVTNPNQKRLAEDLARNVTGSGLVGLGFMLAIEGKATGAAPKDPAERQRWDLAGKQANSVLIGGRWVNVSRVAPLGSLVAVGAQMHDAAAAAKSPEGAVAAATYAPARVALDQSMLKGVSGTLDALNDPGRYGERLMEQTVGSVVPAGVAAVARATDPLQRDPSGAAETIVSRLPGASRTLPARIDALGRPVQNASAGPKALYDIFQTRKASTDPLVRELARVGAAVSVPGKSRTVLGTRETRSAAEYRALLADTGPTLQDALREAIGSPEYQAASAEEQRSALEHVVRAVRLAASAQDRDRTLARRGGAVTAPATLGRP